MRVRFTVMALACRIPLSDETRSRAPRAVVVAAGCGKADVPTGGPVTVTVTQDFGAERLAPSAARDGQPAGDRDGAAGAHTVRGDGVRRRRAGDPWRLQRAGERQAGLRGSTTSTGSGRPTRTRGSASSTPATGSGGTTTARRACGRSSGRSRSPSALVLDATRMNALARIRGLAVEVVFWGVAPNDTIVLARATADLGLTVKIASYERMNCCSTSPSVPHACRWQW